MRAYHPPRRRPFPTVPTAVAKLPINLQRTALYPGRPRVVGNAVEAWQHYMAGQPQPTLLPQGFALSKWKTTPSGRRRWWLAGPMSYMAVSNEYYQKSGVPTRIATRLIQRHHHPAYFPQTAAGLRYGGAQMPVPVGPAEPVLMRAMPRRLTADLLAGQTHIPAPFPRPGAFIETVQARSARAVKRKIDRRNAAEAGARAAVAARQGVAR